MRKAFKPSAVVFSTFTISNCGNNKSILSSKPHMNPSLTAPELDALTTTVDKNPNSGKHTALSLWPMTSKSHKC